MQNIKLNHNFNNCYISSGNRQNLPQQNFYAQNITYPYPVFNQIPYGINKSGYIKNAVLKTLSGDNLHLYTLSNGHKIAIVQSDTSPIIYTKVNVGACDEPDGKEGMSHLIEHSIYHGSKKYCDIDETIKEIGGQANAHTNKHETCYYLELNDANKLDEALDINSDMLFNPTFHKLSKEKPIVASEIQMREGQETSVASSARDKMLLGINKPGIKNIITGSIASVNAITQEDMFNYHSKYYIPQNMTTVVISPKNPDELINTISEKFLSASKGKVQIPTPKRNYQELECFKRNDIISKNSNTKSIVLGFNAGKMSKKEELAALALAKLIAMRYTFNYVLNNEYNDNKTLVFGFDDNNFSEYEKFEYFKQGLKRIKQDGIDDFELQSVKNKIISELDTNSNDNLTYAESIADEISSGNHFEDKEILKSLTKEDIMAILDRINPEKCAMSVIHPKGTSNEELNRAYETYKQFIPSLVIPKVTKPVDVTNNLLIHNLSPYLPTKAYSTTLENNSNLLLTNSKGDTVSFQWNLYSPDVNSFNPALKYILPYMFSSENLQDLYENELTNRHIDVNFDLYEGFEISAQCPKEDIENTVLMAKKYLDIDFSEENFKKAKEKAIDFIKSLQENSSSKRLLDKCGLAFEGDPEALENWLNQATINDLRQYYNHIMSSYSFISVNAPIENNPNLINRIASSFNTPDFYFKKQDQNCFKKMYSKNENRVYITQNESEQPTFQQSYDFRTTSNKNDEIKFQILSKILSERLYNDLREKQGLAYVAFAELTNDGDTSEISLEVSSNCNNKNDVQKIYNSFKNNVESLKQNPVTQKELDEARTSFKKDMIVFYNSISSSHSKLIDAMKTPSGLSKLEDNSAIADSVTIDDIIQAANYAFKDEPDYLIDAPKGLIDENMEYFKALTQQSR